jgi:hypothetical protein
MKLNKIAFSLFTAMTCLVPLAPAHAGPLDNYSTILDPTSSTLARDPKALCSDIVKDKVSETHIATANAEERRNKDQRNSNTGNTWDNFSSSENGNTWDTGNDWHNTKKKSSAQGGSFLGISANNSNSSESSDKGSVHDKGSGSNKRVNHNKGTAHDINGNMTESDSKESSKLELSTKNVQGEAVGKDCNAFVSAAAARDVAALTADGQVKMTEIATKGKVEATKIEAHSKFMENLLKW